MRLTRTRADGVVIVFDPESRTEARWSVIYCMVDNAHQTRQEAFAVGRNLMVGEPLTAHGYTFELVQS